MRRLTSAALGLAICATAGAASAYELKKDEAGHTVRWGEDEVSFAIAAEGARDLSIEDAEHAVIAGFDAWAHTPGAALRFRYDGRVPGLQPGYDRYDPDGNRNAVVWSRDDWAHDPDALAITLTLFRVSTGELVDADIVVNEKAYRWGVGADADNDLQNTLAHEVGHFIGLAHSDVHEATMYPHAGAHAVEKRDLSDDDVAALRALYPGEAPAPAPEALPEGTFGGAHRNDAVAPPPQVAEGQSDPRSFAPNLSCNAAPGGPAYGFWTVLMVLGAVRRRPGARRKGE
jgi:hypothetical protein